MPVTPGKPAPYTAPSAMLEIIGRYRSRGLPAPINKEVLARIGISEGLIARTLQSLQILDLIDDKGMPTQTLKAIQLAAEAEYKKRLEDWLKSAYADVFAVFDPMKDDETRIRDAFRNYEPMGQQTRMVTLFQGLCAAAGLIPEKPTRVGRPPATSRPRPTLTRIVAERFKDAPRHSPRNAPPGVPAPLAGLLTSLPPEGEGWTKADRSKFITTFTAVLDFCFPVVERGAKTEKENGGQETAA